MQGIATRVEEYARTLDKSVRIAVMGCVVNGIGESKGCDIGVAGGKDKSVIFREGKIIATVPNENIFDELKKQIDVL